MSFECATCCTLLIGIEPVLGDGAGKDQQSKHKHGKQAQDEQTSHLANVRITWITSWTDVFNERFGSITSCYSVLVRPEANIWYRGSISRCVIVMRPCLIRPYQAHSAQNAVQDPASAHLDPRQSANIPIVLVLVSVAVPAPCPQMRPSSVRRASDIDLSRAAAHESHSRKALCFRHPLRRSLSFKCCHVPTGSPFTCDKQYGLMI